MSQPPESLPLSGQLTQEAEASQQESGGQSSSQVSVRASSQTSDSSQASGQATAQPKPIETPVITIRDDEQDSDEDERFQIQRASVMYQELSNLYNQENKVYTIKCLAEKCTEISDVDLNKLEGAGFYTVESLLYVPDHVLVKKGFSEAKVKQIKTAVSSFFPMKTQIQPAVLGLAQRQTQVKKFTTGSPDIDTNLDKGIETGSLTEISGESGTGKSQLCMQLAVTCQLPVEMGGGAGKCIYIYTAGNFRPERLVDIAKRYKLNKKDVLDNVSIVQSHNTDHQLLLLDEARKLMTEAKYALLIVDSATSHYRTDYAGLQLLADRQMHLEKFLSKLKQLATEFGIAVLITNEVMAKVGARPWERQIEPCGGNILTHNVTTRLLITRSHTKKNARYCEVLKAQNLVTGHKFMFLINESGIDNVDDSANKK